MRVLNAEAKSAVQAEIDANIQALRRTPGFVLAEPGFPLVGGRFVREPAIIVLVARKMAEAGVPANEDVPRQLGPYRVVVMQASPLQQLQSQEPFSARFETLSGTIPTIYKPPEDQTIDREYTVSNPFLCHVGPDAGWPVLKPFLEETRKTLSVAMYDFNADYIVKTFTGLIGDDGITVALSWDDGMTPEEDAIRASLRKLQGENFRALLVRCGKSRRFASAYHEKVAVRDSRTFWLSSGNWSKRSQPDIDPVGDEAQARGRFSKGNREWHVICEDAKLAGVFEEYIEHDLQGSQDELEQGDHAVALEVPSMGMPEVFVELDALVAQFTEMAAPTAPVRPQRLPAAPGGVRVQPVLTPDNYLKHVEALIDGAQHSLYLQFAYITWSDSERDTEFSRLLLKLAERSFIETLDMRVIVGNNGAADKIRKLVEAGFNQDVFKVQSGIHNKGIVVDGSVVLVSSTNWSSDGVLRNRDAGLIIHDPEVATYYQDVFLEDWEVRARSLIDDGQAAVLALPGEPTPPGMVRMAWRDFHD